MTNKTKDRLAISFYVISVGLVVLAAAAISYLAAAPWSIVAEEVFGWLM